MRLAAALLLLIFAMLSASATGFNAVDPKGPAPAATSLSAY